MVTLKSELPMKTILKNDDVFKKEVINFLTSYVHHTTERFSFDLARIRPLALGFVPEIPAVHRSVVLSLLRIRVFAYSR